MDIKFFIFIFGWIPIQLTQSDENTGNILVKKVQSFEGKISEEAHDSFYEFLQNSDVIVDRSLLLNTLCVDLYGILYNKTIAISAPRNFGKTTNLRMFQFFLQAELDDKGFLIEQKETKAYKYFVEGRVITKGGHVDDFDSVPAISAHEDFIKDNLAQYPVLYLDLKSMETVNRYTNDYTKELLHLISRACFEHEPAIVNLCEHNLNNRGVNFTKLACLSTDYEGYVKARDKKETDPWRSTYSLQFLCQYLKRYYDKPVVVLVDNVDALFTKFYACEKFRLPPKQKTVSEYFLLEFLDSILDDQHLHLGILTGVLPFLLRTYLSGKPDIQYFRYGNEDIFPYYLFTPHQVKQLFKFRDLPAHMTVDAHALYYGYSMEENPNIKSYNPWSIVKLVNTKRLNFYWVREGPDAERTQTFFKSLKIKDTMTHLLADKHLEYRPIPPLNMYYFAELDLLIHEGEHSEKFANFTLGIQYWFLWVTNADGYLIVESRENGSFCTKIPTTENREALIAISMNTKLRFRNELFSSLNVTGMP